LNLIEAIEKVGVEKLPVEFLRERITDITLMKGSQTQSRVTFVSDHMTPGNYVTKNGRVGVIVWFPNKGGF
jgi:hypothetical protein